MAFTFGGRRIRQSQRDCPRLFLFLERAHELPRPFDIEKSTFPPIHSLQQRILRRVQGADEVACTPTRSATSVPPSPTTSTASRPSRATRSDYRAASCRRAWLRDSPSTRGCATRWPFADGTIRRR